MSPMLGSGARRNCERLGGFFIGHAHEVAKFDHLGLDWMKGGKFVEGLVNRQQLVILGGCRQLDVIEVDPLLAAAMTQRAFLASAIDENAPHCLSGRAEEMGTILE